MKPTYLLLDDIRNRLHAEFAGVLFREPVNNGNPATPEGEARYREPHFYVGQLPPKRRGALPDGDDQGEDVPFILVKLLSGDVTGETTREYTVAAGIVFSVYVPEEDPEAGVQDLMNMSDRIMAVLCRDRYWAGNGYFQELPIRMVHGTGKADNVYVSGLQVAGPYYMAAITTQFKAAAIPQIPPKDIVDAAEPKHPAYKQQEN